MSSDDHRNSDEEKEQKQDDDEAQTPPRDCGPELEDALDAVEREARNGRDRAQSEHAEQDFADKHAENG